MPSKRTSIKKIKGILIHYAFSGVKQSKLSEMYKVSRTTISKYIDLYGITDIIFYEVAHVPFMGGQVI